MTYEEYDKKIRDVIASPDTAMVDVSVVLESLKEDLNALDSLKATNEKLQNRVRDLQDTNAKLFLGATSKPDGADDSDPEELEGAAALEDFVKNILKED